SLSLRTVPANFTGIFFMPFFTYILYSQLYNKHYYGSCSNLEIKLKNHNAGKVRSLKLTDLMQ
ncbi:MAG TPA: hypothetical protein PK695_11780, partial [Chitinophagaceae bacterium]|nr:hypothetical protein [Chitinophagaceae bacterium]HNJ56428.1 hypothetical protein [Chitinophagaceae bacterium]HNL60808.1 hypothetical protein [Chitinophagaceae bacterium]